MWCGPVVVPTLWFGSALGLPGPHMGSVPDVVVARDKQIGRQVEEQAVLHDARTSVKIACQRRWVYDWAEVRVQDQVALIGLEELAVGGPTHRDFGTHGRFDDRSTARSLQLWASQHHGLLGALAGGAAAGTVAVVRAVRR